MTDTIHCLICDKDVGIKEVNQLIDYDEQVLSCGHISKLRKIAKSEDVPVVDNVSYNIIQDPQLVNSKEIKIEAKNVGETIPVTVSGDHSIRKERFLIPNLSLLRQGDIFILNGPINAYNVNIGAIETIITTTTDISAIIEAVSSSSHSVVEKEKVKDILTQLNAELPSKLVCSSTHR